MAGSWSIKSVLSVCLFVKTGNTFINSPIMTNAAIFFQLRFDLPSPVTKNVNKYLNIDFNEKNYHNKAYGSY